MKNFKKMREVESKLKEVVDRCSGEGYGVERINRVLHGVLKREEVGCDLIKGKIKVGGVWWWWWWIEMENGLLIDFCIDKMFGVKGLPWGIFERSEFLNLIRYKGEFIIMVDDDGEGDGNNCEEVGDFFIGFI